MNIFIHILKNKIRFINYYAKGEKFYHSSMKGVSY